MGEPPAASRQQPAKMPEARPKVRLFLSEFLTSSGWPDDEDVPPSLLAEGRSMLEAIGGDLAALDDVVVTATWGTRCGSPPDLPKVEWMLTENATHEAEVVLKVARQADAALVIAPESDAILATRLAILERAGVTTWNCPSEVAALCGDKWEVFQRIDSVVPTPSTSLVDWQQPCPEQLPIVVKPRDGAGAVLTFRVETAEDWNRAKAAYESCCPQPQAIWQPWVAGRPCSFAACFIPGAEPIVFPAVAQQFTDDGTLQFLGGEIPFHDPRLDDEARQQLASLINASLGVQLRGYVGFDFILPIDGPPQLLDINPRLTTSYVGYRRLCQGNLAACLIGLSQLPQWRPRMVRYHVDGHCVERSLDEVGPRHESDVWR
ncbi:MAG: ATP-grasp domain-containing protein [Planctomycetaceae bacterium]|nr:ATP-grasp domain-containing protein [Planctomycetaceae bacterium]